MAAYVSPAHLATMLQFDRIEAAARLAAPVLEILNAGSATTVKAVKKAFISLSKQIHPHRGGNFDTERALSAQVIVARAFEQATRAAEFLVSGLPCYHGTAVILLNHGAANMHKFVEQRYLSAPWKEMYAEATYDLPAQHVIDGIMLKAKQRVLSGEYLHAPKALPPPRGRPVKNAGERNQSWYEKGSARPKKRIYLCSLCKLQGHTRAKCDLRQMFEDQEVPPAAPPWGL